MPLPLEKNSDRKNSDRKDSDRKDSDKKNSDKKDSDKKNAEKPDNKNPRQGAKEEAQRWPAGQMLSGRALSLLLLILALVTGFLAYEGVRYSYYSSKAYDQIIYQVKDSTAAHLGVFVLASLGLAAVCRLLDKAPGYQEKICRGVLLFACAWIGVIGFLYIREHPYYPVGDQINTTAGAVYARAGNYAMFQNGGYIGLCEQQKGFVFLYEIFFTLFGDFNYGMTSRFHLGFFIITLLAGYAFLKTVADKPLYRILYCLMMMFCMPYIIYLPYVYGDLPSICFSTVLFAALAAYEKKQQKRYLVMAAVAGVIALLARMHIWIVLIAVGIGMILLALKRGSLRPVLAGLCVILAAAGAVQAVTVMYEYRSGFESGVSMPTVLYLAMGLQETNGAPGIYNRYHQTTYEECNFDREAASEAGKQYIAKRLREMRDNPAYTWNFFLTKVKMQWLEPLFEGLYATSDFADEENIPEWAVDLYYGETHDIVWKAANYYQSMIYLACFGFAAAGLLQRDKILAGSCTGWIPLISVVGGFLFCIIWESQCRYVMPYFVYLVMYAPVGIGTIAEAISGLMGRLAGKREEQGTEDSGDIAA